MIAGCRQPFFNGGVTTARSEKFRVKASPNHQAVNRYAIFSQSSFLCKIQNSRYCVSYRFSWIGGNGVGAVGFAGKKRKIVNT